MAAVFVLSLLLSSNLASAAYGSLGINYTLLDGKLKPGQGSAATLVFANAASGAAYNIKVYVSSGAYITPDASYFELGSIGPGASQSTTLGFNIGGPAVSRNSFITLTAKYNVEGLTAEQQTVVTIPVTIYREPILQISNMAFNASKIKPDDILRMSFNIDNVGAGGAKDVRVLLQNSTAYTYMENNELYSSSIAASGSQTFSFLLQIDSDAKAGIYSIPLQLLYYYEDGKQNKAESKWIIRTISEKAASTKLTS